MFIIQLLDRVTLINVLTATIEPFWVNPFGVCVYILDCWMNWTMYSWKTLQADKTKCILFKMWFLSIFIYLNCMRKWFVNLYTMPARFCRRWISQNFLYWLSFYLLWSANNAFFGLVMFGLYQFLKFVFLNEQRITHFWI